MPGLTLNKQGFNRVFRVCPLIYKRDKSSSTKQLVLLKPPQICYENRVDLVIKNELFVCENTNFLLREEHLGFFWKIIWFSYGSLLYPVLEEQSEFLCKSIFPEDLLVSKYMSKAFSYKIQVGLIEKIFFCIVLLRQTTFGLLEGRTSGLPKCKQIYSVRMPTSFLMNSRGYSLGSLICPDIKDHQMFLQRTPSFFRENMEFLVSLI